MFKKRNVQVFLKLRFDSFLSSETKSDKVIFQQVLLVRLSLKSKRIASLERDAGFISVSGKVSEERKRRMDWVSALNTS